MKIAIFHELDFGGAKRVVAEYARRLRENHYIDLYYVSEKKDKDMESLFNNPFFYKFNSKVWSGNNWRVRLYKDTIELINLFKLHRKIAIDIKSKKYDRILVNPSKYTQAPFLLYFIKNRCIYYCQEPLRIVYDPAVASNIKNIPFPKNIYEFLNRKIRKSIDYLNLSNAKIIIANSNFSKEFIKKSYGRNAKVCYLGVDADLFEPLEIKKTIDILFIGNKDEGHKLLSQSMELFKTKPKLYSILRKNGKLNILDDKLVKIYNRSKILVALNRNEPFGLIPLEAMACGTPVVAVNEGGYKESVLDRKTGYLILRDPKSLYEKVNKIIENSKLRSKMAKQSRKNILNKWTWDKSVSSFLKIIKYAR